MTTKRKYSIGYIAGFISVHLWGRLKGSIHLTISKALSLIFQTKISRFFIGPYCLLNYGNFFHFKKFIPGNGTNKFKTFQDFFTRDFQKPVIIESFSAWPCEGLLCESGLVSDMGPIHVKGETRKLHTVFGLPENEMPNESHYTNVYLHNRNYHHIHSPIDGTITRVQRLSGKLLFLRPWAYKDPSIPALANERVNVDIRDAKGRTWFLSIVGGPVVASIKVPEWLKEGFQLKAGQKMASFEMGSTCCMVSPLAHDLKTGTYVSVGETYQDQND